jgi:quercetin dioxygenase-like cupin family protein
MKETEEILKTVEVRARVMVLAPREIADWHYHTQVTDHIFCLTGTIVIRVQNPDGEMRLAPGGRGRVETGRVHRLENCVDDEASYLLIQGVGKYDFNAIA